MVLQKSPYFPFGVLRIPTLPSSLHSDVGPGPPSPEQHSCHLHMFSITSLFVAYPSYSPIPDIINCKNFEDIG